MKLFINCQSSCIYPGFLSWEGICPNFNLILLLLYVTLVISLGLFIYKKMKLRKHDALVSEVRK